MNDFVKVQPNSAVTPHGAALTLLQIVASVEGKQFVPGGADREWILSTYRECLRSVENP